MFQNKMIQWLVIVLIAITLIVLASFVLWDFLERNNQPTDPALVAQASVDGVNVRQISAAERKEMTVEIRDMTTNLSTIKDFVRISLAFELDNVKAKEEFDLLKDTVVSSMIVTTLSEMTPEDIHGAQGHDALSATLLNKINPLLSEGKLRQVYITYMNIAIQ